MFPLIQGTKKKTNQPKKCYVAKESLKGKLFHYNEIILWVAKELKYSFLLRFSIIIGAGNLKEESRARSEIGFRGTFDCARTNKTLDQLWSSECSIFTYMIQNLFSPVGEQSY